MPAAAPKAVSDTVVCRRIRKPRLITVVNETAIQMAAAKMARKGDYTVNWR